MFERQTDQPLFPKVLWNRPISRTTAGRLLLVGGQKHGVASLQGAYQIAQAIGIGALTLLVPDGLRPLLGTLPEIDFGPSTPSGSLAGGSLATLGELAAHSDTVLVGIDASNNSETAILTEKFVATYERTLIVADDGLAVVAQTPDLFRARPHTLVMLSMQQLFKLAGQLGLPIHIQPDSGIAGKVAILQDFWSVLKVDLALLGADIIIKTNDQISVTPLLNQPSNLLPAAYGILAVFYCQNPGARFEGLTTGAFLLRSAIPAGPSITIPQLCSRLNDALKVHE